MADGPPAGAIPLREFVWSHPAIIDAVIRRLDAALNFDDRLSADDPPEPADHEFQVSGKLMTICLRGESRPWFYLGDFGITSLMQLLEDQREAQWVAEYGEPSGFHEIEDRDDPTTTEDTLPVWQHPGGFARDCMASASHKFRELLFAREIALIGRWRSMQSPFELLPTDAWPVHPDRLYKGKKLDFAKGWIELASGEKVYSLHIVRNDQQPEAVASSGTAAGERRLEKWFSDIVDRHPNLRVLTNHDLKAQALRFGASKEAVKRVRAKVLAEKSEAVSEIWKQSGRLAKEAAAFRMGLIEGAD